MSWITMMPVAILFGYVIFSISRYKNRPKREPFFFEGDKLVLDAVLRMHEIPVLEIDHVELKSSASTTPYMITITVVKKNKKTKTSPYMGYTSLSDLVEMLEKRGIYCEVTNA
ncbi:MAG: hypothetical protein K2H91_03675 [Lachnospiraceae bacterium]|nr:hypothetical protein [Lachnospiraceae bacterium]